MSAFVDTNIIVRHLTGDPPEQAQRATRFLREAEELLLTDLIEVAGIRAVASFDKSAGRVSTVRHIVPGQHA